MRVRSHVAVLALEGLEAVGLERTELLTAVGLDEQALADPRGHVEWATYTALLDFAWIKLGKDPERMRLVGGAVARAPSYALLRKLARTGVSANRIYEVVTRW